MNRDSNDPKKKDKGGEWGRNWMEGLNGCAAGRGEDVGFESKCWRERRKVNAGWEGDAIEAKVA